MFLTAVIAINIEKRIVYSNGYIVPFINLCPQDGEQINLNNLEYGF